MRRTRAAVVIVMFVASALAARALMSSEPQRPDPRPPTAQATAAAGWKRIEPGGRTRTARGEPYAFWVRRGDARRLMLFFQEGGGCFSYEMCAPGSRFFDDAVDASDDPSGEGGVLDQRDPRNPFRDHTTVFIPSATGDVHWGDARVRYRAGSQRIDVEHRGFVNAMAAVRWAFRHVPNPRSVLVTGCSAGSVGSAAFAPYVIRRYPHARVTQLGDSLAFVFDGPVDLSNIRAYANMPRWIAAVRALRPGRHTMADYYVAIARQYPDATFAQINHASDAVQREFYAAAGGDPTHFDADLRAALDEIHAGAPNFRSYLAPGVDHCVLPFATFHTLRHQGVSVRDWTARLAAGQPVRDVG
jgi:Pectinacetylesterase